MFTSILPKKSAVLLAAGALALGAVVYAQERQGPQQPWSKWHVHDMSRPTPPIITPPTPSTQEQPGQPPSDAIVLFDGKDLSHWQSPDGSPPTFTLQDGVMLSTNLKNPRNTKDVQSKEKWGDIQLHLEWSEPTPPKGTSQGRGNSGILFFGIYEVQVLDSYKDDTYADGQCGAIYGQYPPLVNACRPPGEFQTYDIVFHAPLFDDQKKVIRPGTFTVFQNGVLIQDHVQLTGTTAHGHEPRYDYFQPTGKLQIQDHGNKVRYRQIWIRKLGPEVGVANPSGE